MTWHDILKAPPIRNPRESEFKNNANDDLSRAEYVELFQERVDPIIHRDGKKRKTYASIEKISSWINFIPQTDIEAGVEKFIKWFKDYYK